MVGNAHQYMEDERQKICINCGTELTEKRILGVFCTECCRIEYFNKDHNKVVA